MKKNMMILFGALYLVTLSSWAGNTEKFAEKRKASFNWTQTVHDFGTIKKDAPVTYSFSFQNSGDHPLVIVSVKGSCGCTVADYTKGEIPAGQVGQVDATYNAAVIGIFNKTITVNANTGEGPITLRIQGEVVE